MSGFEAAVFPAGLFKAATGAAAVFGGRPTGRRTFKGTASTRLARGAAASAVTISDAAGFARATGLDGAFAVRAVLLAGTLRAAASDPSVFRAITGRLSRGATLMASLPTPSRASAPPISRPNSACLLYTSDAADEEDS